MTLLLAPELPSVPALRRKMETYFRLKYTVKEIQTKCTQREGNLPFFRVQESFGERIVLNFKAGNLIKSKKRKQFSLVSLNFLERY